MIASEMLEKIGESLGSTATVKTVFGEPIQVEGKTVVPIAKVAYGFGAGGAPKLGRKNDDGESPEGGGGGGGVCAFPAGALEITPEQTRFVPFIDYRWILGAAAIGVVIGHLLARRRG
jgi:uncharacterized spore protein YtfJ